MQQQRRPWRRILFWGVGVLLFVQALSFLMPARIAPVGPFNLIARTVINSAASVRNFSDAVGQGVDRYFANADAMAQLQDLQLQHEQLKLELQYANHFIESRQTIDELSGWPYQPWAGTIAKVVFHDPMDRYNSAWIRLPKGAAVDNHAVLSSQGLFGRVVAQAGRSAQVLLINDVESAVDTVSDKGVRVIVRGTGGKLGRVDFVPRYEPLSSGDLLWTTGRDAAYPAGISVGVIENVERSSEQLYLSASVAFSADINQVTWVNTVAPDEFQP